MSFNLATILRESASAHPDKPMLRLGTLTLTYGQVDQLSGQVAAGLREAGLARGDSVALQLPNVPQFVLAYFGALKAGMTLVPLNPLLKAPEVAYHLSDSGARVLVTFDAFAEEAVKGAADAGDVRVYVVSSPGGPEAPPDTTPFDALVAAGQGADPTDVEQMSPEDTAVVIYTSGTTGRPKGAELTHFQAYMAASVAAETFAYRDDDVAMAVLPLFHVFGLSSVMNCAVRAGATLVLVPRFDVGAVLDAMEQHRVTVFCGVPTMFVALMHADLTGRDVSMLRICVSGGASIPGEVIKGFEAAYDATILEGYGLSETCAVATFNRSAEERRVLSIGKRLWGCEVRVVDAEDRPLPPGADNVGEIVLRGHNIMKGYLGRPEATAEAMRGGWFHTGDIGYMDEDEFFYIVDRKKDLVIRGGFNVYPREIEEVLHAHPAVREAAVIGKPDERLGEEVVAYVSLRSGASAEPTEVIAFCKERLAAYKYPREVIVIEELPKGPSGKVLKTELRAR
ncbi:long-chain acyl-CoA synthetase [Geodermatophilus bullaregiensis]|uniref:long-chain-fatty-acid--CoA ligase n=1 Tax=Geodermatophilus bullaregiensis TaxID=1564160 RepID=UPI00195B5D7B|nr:long-chain fatty acid--CoA ligase [Geodermatophilus bullaregiensis]MBM7805073.1 long-chain acyl-CoA synthetase [Geodermatophilus bullaregiensis]